jgi:hypothetical protein
MSEMGALLEAMKRFGECGDCLALADATVAGLALYGLDGVVQVRTPDAVVTRSREGDASPLEVSVINHMTTMERITQYRTRMSITYKSVSLLVSNMPVADPDRCGRLRDHLAMLAEAAESRVETILATAESMRRGNSIGRAIDGIIATLGEIDRAQRDRQVATRLAVESLTQRMESAYVSLALTNSQEDLMNETLQAGINQLLATQTDTVGMQDQLSAIVRELQSMTIERQG